jgi:hypothetical protein
MRIQIKDKDQSELIEDIAEVIVKLQVKQWFDQQIAKHIQAPYHHVDKDNTRFFDRHDHFIIDNGKKNFAFSPLAYLGPVWVAHRGHSFAGGRCGIPFAPIRIRAACILLSMW